MNPLASKTSRVTKRRRARAAILVLGASVAGLAAAVVAAAGGGLFINGKLASNDVRMINGTRYVPVSDVAKALGLTVTRRSDGGYDLNRPGGADQVEGAPGKVGDTLFTGQWRVTVLNVETPVDTYAMKSEGEPYGEDTPSSYNATTRIIRAKPGATLVVVRCRIANGQRTPQTLWLTRRDSKTALADAQGESYPPVAYDVDGAPIQTKSLLPGARLEIPIIFAVPQETQLKDLVFTANNNDDTRSRQVNNVRVQLR